MNRITVFLEHIFEGSEQLNIPAEEMLLMAKAAGIDGLDCDLWRLEDKAVKAMFDRCKMSVTTSYCHYDLGHEPRQKALDRARHQLELTAYYGADKILCLPGAVNAGENADEIRKVMAQRLNELCEIAAEYGITVTLEDFDSSDSPCSTTAGLVYFMQNVPQLRFTFDTGNFAYCMESAQDAYARLKQYVVHVHLKERTRDRSHANKDFSNAKADLSGEMMFPAPVGSGYIGIKGLVRQLLADGYGGSFSIEHFGAVNQLEYMKQSAAFIRRIMEEKHD